MNPEVKEVKVSPKAWNTTLIFEDGSKDVIPLESFLKMFGDWRKAVLEYMMYIYIVVGKHVIAMKAINEIKRKLLPS